MKDITVYLNESLIEDRIDEGFKDFIRKAAITAAVATSCLTAMASPKTQPDSFEDAKYNISQTITNLNKKYNSTIHFVIGTADNALGAQREVKQQIIDYVKEKTGSNQVDDAKINKMIGVVSTVSYQSKSNNNEWSQIIYFIDRSESEDTNQKQAFINDCGKDCSIINKWVN